MPIDPRLLTLTGDAETWRGPLDDACDLYEIATPQRQAHFLAQAAHESAGFTLLTENLRYSAAALLQTWPRRFTPASAVEFAYNPERIAERVYGGRMGNGPEGSGDGWRYRGRGLFQVTGRANYEACGRELGLDLLSAPHLLCLPRNAARSAGWYWRSRGCNALADEGDFEGITQKVNGGTNGLAERAGWLVRAERALAQEVLE